MTALGVPFEALPDAAQHLTVSGGDVPVTILTIPKAWVLVMPCGCIDGIMRGSERTSTADAVWVSFFPNKRARDVKVAKGWTVRAATTEDIERAKHAPDHEGHNS